MTYVLGGRDQRIAQHKHGCKNPFGHLTETSKAYIFTNSSKEEINMIIHEYTRNKNKLSDVAGGGACM